MQENGIAAALSAEFAQADLQDPRRRTRLMRLAEQLSASSESSLPKKIANPSQLEAAYRFLNNPHVGPAAVFDAHIKQTVSRASDAQDVLVIHDTTKFQFGGESHRDGLGRIQSEKSRGFLGHYSLCLGAGDGKPLGALHLYAWSRPQARKGRRPQQESQYDPDREYLRWSEGVSQCSELLFGVARAVHVMDREGDSLELLADLLEQEARFVIRVAHDRRVDSASKHSKSLKLFDVLDALPVLIERDVPLSPRRNGRAPGQSRRHPARKMRMARLSVGARSVRISPGNGSVSHLPDELTLNFVYVCEQNPPEGESPVVWRLVTTEPIDTTEQIVAIIDMYRKRWVIEEFFKALKSGLGYQELQLESARALSIALALYSAVAWQILLLRWLDRHQPDQPAIAVLTSSQIQVLVATRRKTKKPLPENPTTHEALLAIAALGGHLSQNGPPGWETLTCGFQKLLAMEEGWLARDGDRS